MRNKNKTRLMTKSNDDQKSDDLESDDIQQKNLIDKLMLSECKSV